jgi:hypothetical protein
MMKRKFNLRKQRRKVTRATAATLPAHYTTTYGASAGLIVPKIGGGWDTRAADLAIQGMTPSPVVRSSQSVPPLTTSLPPPSKMVTPVTTNVFKMQDTGWATGRVDGRNVSVAPTGRIYGGGDTLRLAIGTDAASRAWRARMESEGAVTQKELTEGRLGGYSGIGIGTQEQMIKRLSVQTPENRAALVASLSTPGFTTAYAPSRKVETGATKSAYDVILSTRAKEGEYKPVIFNKDFTIYQSPLGAYQIVSKTGETSYGGSAGSWESQIERAAYGTPTGIRSLDAVLYKPQKARKGVAKRQLAKRKVFKLDVGFGVRSGIALPDMFGRKKRKK